MKRQISDSDATSTYLLNTLGFGFSTGWDASINFGKEIFDNPSNDRAFRALTFVCATLRLRPHQIHMDLLRPFLPPKRRGKRVLTSDGGV